MPSALKDLTSRLIESREGELPSIQAFPPLDLDQIARQLGLESRGEESGKENSPPSDAGAPDVAELNVGTEIEHRARKAGEDYRSQLSLYDGRARRAVVTSGQPVEIAAAGLAALGDFKAHVINDLDHLHLQRKNVEASEQELRAFQDVHRLQRLPRVPSSGERIFRTLLLLIFIAFEAGLNGLFFAEGSTAGIIGGFLQAILFSAMNVGAAVIFAVYGFPLLKHRKRTIKSVGLVSVFVYAAFDLALNLGIAHFRDLFIAGSGTVSAIDFWSRVSVSPLGLVDMQSWVLFAVGVGLSIATFIDSIGLNDSYPGFGQVGRHREEAISSYANEKAQRLQDLMERRNEALAEMKEVIAVVRSCDLDVRLAHEGCSRLHRDFLAYMDHLAGAHEMLVLRYRESNRKTRTTVPPDYFNAPFTRSSFLAGPGPHSLPAVDGTFSEKAVSHMEHYIQAVNEEFSSALLEYSSVSQLTTQIDSTHGAS